MEDGGRSELVEKRAKPTIQEAERILINVGLNFDQLEDKTILDLGSGNRFLERGAKEKGIKASIVSYDRSRSALLQGIDTKLAVQGEANEGLPFQDQSFDIVVNNGGPLTYRDVEDRVGPVFYDVIRVLKVGGELRSNNPFKDHRLGSIIYQDVKEKGLIVSPQDIERFTRRKKNDIQLAAKKHIHSLLAQGEDSNIVENQEREIIEKEQVSIYDDSGLPIDSQFWINQLDKLYSIEDRKLLMEKRLDEVREQLSSKGENVTLTLVDKDIHQQAVFYNPYLVLKKIA